MPHLQAALSRRGTLPQVSLLGMRGLQLLLHLRQALLMVAYLAVQLAQLTTALGLHSIGEGLTSWSQAESNDPDRHCVSQPLLAVRLPGGAHVSVNPIPVSLHMLCCTVQPAWAGMAGVQLLLAQWAQGSGMLVCRP